MARADFVLSAFGDEVADDLATQLDVLASEGVHYLEIRGAWGRNILDLDAAQLKQADVLLRERGFGVSAIATPIGKSRLTEPREFELERLDRAIAVAMALDTRLIRVFSFFVEAGAQEQHRDEVLARMAGLTERAAAAGMTLVHENEKEIYGDVPERCREIMDAVAAPALRMAFDPANFVQVGVRPMEQAWPLLADFTTHVHIKDAIFTGEVRPAGEGDGALPDLLETLAARGYCGFLTLEPHLKVAGPMGGFSGEAGMRTAIRALRKLLENVQDVHIA